jgi:ABC-2 type transport system ATP-binding protein
MHASTRLEAASMAPYLETRNLTKFYGSALGIENVSLQIEPGEIFGLLGPNGAGKTTLIRCATGLLRPTSGGTLLFGEAVRTFSDRNHERLGYLPADLRLWPRLSARRTSDLLLGIGAKRPDRRRRDELADRLNLDLKRIIKSLSLGNRQKVGLMLALQHDPDLVVLDEPTSGLDPLVRRTVMELLRERAAAGRTIVYSSHNLNEVEQICSRVAILREGRLAALQSIEQLRSEREQRLEFVLIHPESAPEALPAELERFKLHKIAAGRWQVRFRGSPGPLLDWLSRQEIAELTPIQVSLEEAFLTYYRDERGRADDPRADDSGGGT